MRIRGLGVVVACVFAGTLGVSSAPTSACGTAVTFVGRSPGQAPPVRDLSDRAAARAEAPVTLLGDEALGIPRGTVLLTVPEEAVDDADPIQAWPWLMQIESALRVWISDVRSVARKARLEGVR